MRHELGRKALHLLSLAVPVLYALDVPRVWLLWLVGSLAGIALVVEIGRVRSPAVRAQFVRRTGALLRAHEHERIAGATWLLLAFFSALLVLPRDIAIAATWAAALGDASAGIVGRTLGRIRFGAAKTLEGSVACFLATLAGAVLVAQLPIGAAVAGALGATAAEHPETRIDDNVRIVAGASAGILLWRLVFS